MSDTAQRIAAIANALPHPLVIAIDGRAAAGKTTLANALSALLCAPVVQMDHFFLPAALRTETRYAEAGGNVDYARFLADVLPHLLANESFAYRPFDCKSMTLSEEIQIPAAPVRIVEGSYALHPRFGVYAQLSLFCDVDRTVQRTRILARNGASAETFFQRWIPLEEAYFSAYGIRESAKMVVA